MAKLYFKYGAMGSSKTAQALITKYNYEENDLNVWLIKPGTDTRDGAKILRSRIGLESPADVIAPGTDIYLLFQDTQEGKCDVIIVDECQFLTESQIDQLRALVNDYNIPVMCFGLRTDFQTRLFPGSRRLMEVADTIQGIKTICDCGRKATTNAQIRFERILLNLSVSTATVTSSPRARRWCWAATTATLPCVTSATSGASGSTGSSGSTDTTESYTEGESSWN